MIGITRKIGETYTYVGSYKDLHGTRVRVTGWTDWGHGLKERGYDIEVIDGLMKGDKWGNVSANSLTSV